MGFDETKPPAPGWEEWAGVGDRRGWQRRLGAVVAIVVEDPGSPSEFSYSIVEEPTRIRLGTGIMHVSLPRTCHAVSAMLSVLRPSTTAEVRMVGDGA